VSDADLTGRWHGFYSYGVGARCAFDAELRDHGGALVGVTHEVAGFGPAPGSTLTASLEGQRAGSAVDFVKTYDEIGLAYYSIRYTGTLAADGNEIEGRWVIVGGPGSGRFLMVRESGAGAEEDVRAAETVQS